MIRLLESLLESRTLLILGFGKEGRSTYAFVRTHFPGLGVAVSDQDEGIRAEFPDSDPAVTVSLHLGPDYLDALDQYSLVIKSPGVALPERWNAPAGQVITSQTDLVLEAYRDRIIGITGTKGKSTTTSLVQHILRTAGVDSILVGNIGRPPFDYLSQAGPVDRIVFEMSSHQLEHTSLAPAISVLLNLFPEHLDRYRSLSAYYDAKMKILTGQKTGDVFIYNEDIPEIAHRIHQLGADRRYLTFSAGIRVDQGCFLVGDDICLSENGVVRRYLGASGGFRLRGRHNLMNAMAAVLAARSAGAPDDSIREGLRTFTGLEHRLEYVGLFRGIHFYNDSIATIPEATLAAIRALPDTDTLILGGYDRNLDYQYLVDVLSVSGIRNFFFLGRAGQRMLELFRVESAAGKRLLPVNSLEEAFGIIPEVTEAGKICLLSPAAASYDLFRNFEERGSIYKKLAESL